MTAGGLVSYVRAIERLWSDRSERAVVLSPREWTLVERWYERGIPLEIVQQAIEHRAAGRRARRPPRNLSYLAPAVEEAWAVVVQGRVGDPGSGVGEVSEAIACWRRVLGSGKTAPALRELVESLLAEAARGVDAEELDRRLDRALPEIAPPDLLNSLRARMTGQIESYRNRMTPEIVEETINRAVLSELRRSVGLPRLHS